MRMELEAAEIKALADEVALRVNRTLALEVAGLKAELADLKALLHKALGSGPAQGQGIKSGQGRTVERAILGRRERLALTGLTGTTQWRLEKAGDFPARFPTSARRVGWRRDEVMSWIDKRQAA